MSSVVGTFETCRLALMMSVHWVDRKWLTRRQNDEIDPKRSSATHSRLHFGRPGPWEGRLAARTHKGADVGLWG
jgi:hypothetical protein